MPNATTNTETTVSSNEIKQFLESSGWTQQKLAERLGIGRANVSRWITGDLTPRQGAVHLAVRYLIHSHTAASATPSANFRQWKVSNDFDLSQACCMFPGCKREGHMYARSSDVWNHPLLGKIAPVSCNGTPANPHRHITRAVDRAGRVWNLAELPPRRKLAPFESEAVLEARRTIGAKPDPEALTRGLARCTTALDGTPGCGRFLKYQGRESSSDRARRKLHRFICEGCKPLRRKPRLFDNTGAEVPAKAVGMGNLGRRRLRLPSNAKVCPVCGATWNIVKKVIDIGGEHYDPPLLNLVCANPKRVNHVEGRGKLKLPKGVRHGLSFYYDKKSSQWTEPYRKALRKGSPKVVCRTHGRMRTVTYAHRARVPKWVYNQLGPQLPIVRAHCPCQERWIPTDKAKTPIRRSLPRPRQKPLNERIRAARRAAYYKQLAVDPQWKTRRAKYERVWRAENTEKVHHYNAKNRAKRERQGKAPPPATRTTITVDVRKISALRDEGKSWAAIARELGLSVGTCWRAYRESGLSSLQQ